MTIYRTRKAEHPAQKQGVDKIPKWEDKPGKSEEMAAQTVYLPFASRKMR